MAASDSWWGWSVTWMAVSNNRSKVRFYNNTAYGYGSGYPGLSEAGYGIEVDFGGTWEWVNNLVVDTLGVPFTATGGVTPAPTASTSNLWWGVAATRPLLPSFDPSGTLADPLFAAAPTDFRVPQASPATDHGSASAAGVVARDLDGTARPQGATFDIGAYEFVRACSLPVECITPPPCRQAAGASCSGSTCSYPPSPDGTACLDDGDLCTDDLCRSGSCQHPAAPGRCVDAGPAGPDAAVQRDAAAPDAASPGTDGGAQDGGGGSAFRACGCSAGGVPVPLVLMLLAGAGALRRRQ